jgi:hypothetical protein
MEEENKSLRRDRDDAVEKKLECEATLEAQTAYLNDVILRTARESEQRGKDLAMVRAHLESAHESADQKYVDENAHLQKDLEDRAAEILRLQKSLDSVHDFMDKKVALKKEKDALERDNQMLHDLHANHVRDMEIRLEKERQEWSTKLADELGKSEDKLERRLAERLDITTRKTIADNSKLSGELRYQIHASEKLLQENTLLLRDKAATQTEMDALRLMNERLTKRVAHYEGVFTKLTAQHAFQSLPLLGRGTSSSLGGPPSLRAGSAVDFARSLSRSLPPPSSMETSPSRMRRARRFPPASPVSEAAHLRGRDPHPHPPRPTTVPCPRSSMVT